MKEFFNTMKKDVKQYGMFIALLVVMLFFTATTGGTFLTSRNLSNLFDQTGYVAVLAIGMTLILIIRQIDLSVGYACGFIGALAALLMKNTGIPVVVIVLGAMAVGVIIGLYQGFLVAKCAVPAFVVTLAGMFIFRGALLLVTGGIGTIIVKNPSFNAIGNGFIPDFFNHDIPHEFKIPFHILTMILGLALVCFIILTGIKDRKNRAKYNLQDTPFPLFVAKMFFMTLLIMFFTTKLALYHGLSWTVVIVLVVLAIYAFLMDNTVLGRHIYAVGGNPEAAELSGINVQKITMFVFCSMGALAGLAGILFTSRLQSATPTAGNAFEMDAIASCYVGGVSAAGGSGRVTGTIIGALVMSALTNGMNLMGIGIAYQYIVRGAILILAVLFDVRARRIKV